jgi:hypothetical protein
MSAEPKPRDPATCFSEWPDQPEEALASLARGGRRPDRQLPLPILSKAGQVGPVSHFACSVARPRSTSRDAARGHRLGDIKPTALRLGQDWSSRFHGYFVG